MKAKLKTIFFLTSSTLHTFKALNNAHFLSLVHCHPSNGVVHCTSDTNTTATTAVGVFEENTCTFCYNTSHYALQGSNDKICISEEVPLCITG